MNDIRANTSARGEDILIVEDDQVSIQLMTAILKNAGYTLRAAREGELAVQSASAAPPALVLLDIGLPDIDGFEVLRRLRADDRTADIPVIFLTGMSDSKNRVRALQAGAVDYVVKPFEKEEILTRIENQLNLKRALKAFQIEHEKLRISEDRQRAVLSHLTVGIVVVGDDDRVEFANQSFIDAFQLNEHSESLIGLAASEFIALVLPKYADPESTAEQIRRMVLKGELAVGREIQLKNGHVAQVDFVPLPRGRMWVHHDVTERKRTERENQEMQAGLAQSDRLVSIGMLAAGVAHEINNPLSYVISNLSTTVTDLPKLFSVMKRCCAALTSQLGIDANIRLFGDDFKFFNSEMHDDIMNRLRWAVTGADRIKTISRSLGAFSRVDRAKAVPVNVQSSIEYACTIAFNEIKYRARLVKDFSNIPDVLVSEGKLAQLFLNLLINAAHAIDEGHVENNEIRVRTWTEGDFVFVEVKDTGRGIEKEHQAQIFNPFFTTKAVGVGTGLGLSICKRIVTEFEGEISFETELKKGTRFTVKLPQVPKDWSEFQESVQKDVSSKPPSLRGRILIVDDEEGVRLALSRMLGNMHEFVLASSGKEALDVLSTDKNFDVLLVDLIMPQMSGMELHDKLRDQDPIAADRVVFMSGGAFTPGAADYLANTTNIRIEKPFDIVNFPRMVDRLVTAVRAMDAASAESPAH
jgi:CheY-like chemotaxis protein